MAVARVQCALSFRHSRSMLQARAQNASSSGVLQKAPWQREHGWMLCSPATGGFAGRWRAMTSHNHHHADPALHEAAKEDRIDTMSVPPPMGRKRRSIKQKV